MRMVYVIGPEDGPYKVGIAGDPVRRLSEIQTGNHLPMRLHFVAEAVNAKAKETALHVAMKAWSIGGEWFKCALSEIESLFIEHGLEPVKMGAGRKAKVIDPYFAATMGYQGMPAEQFKHWLNEMRRKSGTSFDDCAALLNLSPDEMQSMIAAGADRRTALACRALLHRMTPYGED